MPLGTRGSNRVIGTVCRHGSAPLSSADFFPLTPTVADRAPQLQACFFQLSGHGGGQHCPTSSQHRPRPVLAGLTHSRAHPHANHCGPRCGPPCLARPGRDLPRLSGLTQGQMSADSDFGVSVFSPPKERRLVFPVLPVPSWTRLEFGDWEKESRTPILDVSQGPFYS